MHHVTRHIEFMTERIDTLIVCEYMCMIQEGQVEFCSSFSKLKARIVMSTNGIGEERNYTFTNPAATTSICQTLIVIYLSIITHPIIDITNR